MTRSSVCSVYSVVYKKGEINHGIHGIHGKIHKTIFSIYAFRWWPKLTSKAGLRQVTFKQPILPCIPCIPWFNLFSCVCPCAYPVFFQEIVQSGAADFEKSGRLADVVAAQGQGLMDNIFLRGFTGLF